MGGRGGRREDPPPSPPLFIFRFSSYKRERTVGTYPFHKSRIRIRIRYTGFKLIPPGNDPCGEGEEECEGADGGQQDAEDEHQPAGRQGM